MNTITKDQWYAHPSFRVELEELINHKTFQIALAIVNKGGLKPTPYTAGVDLRDFFALMGSKRDGYFESLQNLTDLAKQPQAPRPPEPPPWTTQKPGADDARDSAP